MEGQVHSPRGAGDTVKEINVLGHLELRLGDVENLTPDLADHVIVTEGAPGQRAALQAVRQRLVGIGHPLQSGAFAPFLPAWLFPALAAQTPTLVFRTKGFVRARRLRAVAAVFLELILQLLYTGGQLFRSGS